MAENNKMRRKARLAVDFALWETYNNSKDIVVIVHASIHVLIVTTYSLQLYEKLCKVKLFNVLLHVSHKFTLTSNFVLIPVIDIWGRLYEGWIALSTG